MDSNKQSQATLDLRQLFIQPHPSHRFSKNLISPEAKNLSAIPNVGVSFSFSAERRHWTVSRNKLHVIA